MSRLFRGGSWLAVLALVCQLGLPLLHAGHLAVHAGGPWISVGAKNLVLAAPAAEADENHHHPADCPVCRYLSRSNVTLPGTGFALAIPVFPAAKLAACPPPASFLPHFTTSISPRAPPAA